MDHINLKESRLGQYLLRTNTISQKTLERALKIQKDLPFLKLGEILLGLHAITFRDLTEALYQQFSDTLFGHVLIRRKIVTREQLQEALERQATDPQRQRLGEILIAMGYATTEQIDEALAERELMNQYKYRLGFNRYFVSEDEADAEETLAASSNPPPGWMKEIAALDVAEPASQWVPGLDLD